MLGDGLHWQGYIFFKSLILFPSTSIYFSDFPSGTTFIPHPLAPISDFLRIIWPCVLVLVLLWVVGFYVYVYCRGELIRVLVLL